MVDTGYCMDDGRAQRELGSSREDRRHQGAAAGIRRGGGLTGGQGGAVARHALGGVRGGWVLAGGGEWRRKRRKISPWALAGIGGQRRQA